MSDFDKNLSSILGTAPITAEYTEITSNTKIATTETVVATNDVNNVETDADSARSEIYNIINHGNAAITELSMIARDTQHPRAYEVIATLLKTQAENVDKLLKIQKDKSDLLSKTKDTNENGNTNTNINVDKAVFVGTTADLLKAIRNKT